MPSNKPVQRLNDILDNIGWIQDYTRGKRYSDFAQDRLIRDAVERCLLRISEAARKLEGLVDGIASDQPWADIRSLRNIIRHEYDAVEAAVIWQIVENDLQPLRNAVDSAIRKLQRSH